MWQLVPALDPRNHKVSVTIADAFGGGGGGGYSYGIRNNAGGYATGYYESSAQGTYVLHSAVSNYDAKLGGYYSDYTGVQAYNQANFFQNWVANSPFDTLESTSRKAFQGEGACFIAGTLVLAEEGHVPIEEIEAGDLVWATDPETGETALKRVVQLFRNEATELVHVTVNGETIVCTNEHPFYSPVKGWTEACKLRAGDILVSVNGEYVVVEQVQHELLEAPITVYNFEVEDFHTYYVGDTDGVLVHNTCGKNSSSKGVGGKGWIGDKTWRKNVSTVGNGGTITSLNGGVPTQSQAIQLITQSGGTILRIEGAHQFPNPHNYPHINYVTENGTKGTIKIFE